MSILEAQRQLTERYRTARLVWRHNAEIRQAAQTLGMSEREYCDRFVASNFGPLAWTSSGTSDSTLDFDRAFTEAPHAEG